MAEHVAASLAALRSELNRRWPDRDKRSDGAKGDPAHAGRVSDHNPDWSAPGARAGVIRAIDVDKDGIDVQELLDAVVGDPRAAYVIWNHRIASATDDGRPWDWEPYNGPNAHTEHVHISIKHSAQAENDTSAWFKAANPEEWLVGAREDILAYQKACTIQIQNNNRQLIAAATERVLDYLKVCTIQIQENTRQIDATSDQQVADQLAALESGMTARLEELKTLELEAVPEPEPAT
jgi:hypothetical protein